MMRVTVEIVPHGNEDEAHIIHTVCIANTEVAPFGFRGYRYWLDKPVDAEPDGWVFHQRSDGAVELARRVLDQVRLDQEFAEGQEVAR